MVIFTPVTTVYLYKKWKLKLIGRFLREKLYTQSLPFYFPPIDSLLDLLYIFVPCTFACASLSLPLFNHVPLWFVRISYISNPPPSNPYPQLETISNLSFKKVPHFSCWGRGDMGERTWNSTCEKLTYQSGRNSLHLRFTQHCHTYINTHTHTQPNPHTHTRHTNTQTNT